MSDGRGPWEAYLAALPVGVAPPGDDLGHALESLHAAGRAAWPDLAVAPGAFARHLASLATPGAWLPDPAFAEDVYLAIACALGAPGAAAALERAHAADLARALGRAGGGAAFVEDTRQIVWEKLLVPAAGRPAKIAEYAGRAPLRSFLRTVAVRTAIDLRRKKDEDPSPRVDAAALGVGADPELGYLAERYKADLEEAVRRSLAALSPRDRAILRLHFEQKMSVDALGAHYGVGRSTAARWLKAARDGVAEGVRSDLGQRLGLTPSELRSVARLVQSRLDVSVLRHLASGDP
jgi:RNA polymerase sigma-70 factor (ECF subfamily)